MQYVHLWIGCSNMESEEISNGNIFVLRGGVQCNNFFSFSIFWLRRILVDLNYKQEKATKIYCKNNSTILKAKITTFHGTAKNTDIHYSLFACWWKMKSPYWIFWNTNEQRVYIFSKALAYKQTFLLPIIIWW